MIYVGLNINPHIAFVHIWSPKFVRMELLKGK